MNSGRRKTMKQIGTGLAATSVFGLGSTFLSCKGENTSNETTMKLPFFKISLAQWSLHKSFFGDSLKDGFGNFFASLQTNPDALLQGHLNPANFPLIAKNEFGMDAIEYVNTFYYSKAKDMDFWKEMKAKCDGEGVKSILIMCDALGDLGNLDQTERQKAIEAHHPWVDIAKFMGCHAIRVNAAGTGTADEVRDAAVQGLGSLTEYGKSNGVNIIVENHGGYSSDGQWLASVMKQVNSEWCGTLPDFGNFCLERNEDFSCKKEYDKYKGIAELMPYAKGVSAKAHDFDAEGNETFIDYHKMLQIVKDAGFSGYIDIEYEGSVLSEPDGIRATKSLLERVGAELA